MEASWKQEQVRDLSLMQMSTYRNTNNMTLLFVN